MIPLFYFITIVTIESLPLSSVLAQDDATSATSIQDFSLKIVVPTSVPIEGPIEIKAELVYTGSKLRVVSFDEITELNLDIEAIAPTGWEERSRILRFISLGLVEPTFCSLQKGQSISGSVFLHDYFKTLQVGKAEFKARLYLSRSSLSAGSGDLPLLTDKEPERVAFESSFSLTVDPPDPIAFKRRLVGAFRFLREHRDEDRKDREIEAKLRVLRGLENLSHPDLIEIFLFCLRSPELLSPNSQTTAIQVLLKLGQEFGDWRAIVEYLVSSGTRVDGIFFGEWQRRGIALDVMDLRKICYGGNNYWIRYYALEYLVKDDAEKRRVASVLRRDIGELTKLLDQYSPPDQE